MEYLPDTWFFVCSSDLILMSTHEGAPFPGRVDATLCVGSLPSLAQIVSLELSDTLFEFGMGCFYPASDLGHQ